MGFHVSLELLLVVLTLLSGLILLYYRVVGKQYKENKEPLALDYARSFFPILLIVLVVRSFIAEPFRIPSGSMIPTLQVGDFVLVKKYTYGVKLPVIHTKVIETGEPKRGDVVVFRYPHNPKINYIKRLVGLPGDTIEWTADKQLYVNGKKTRLKHKGKYQATISSSIDKVEETFVDNNQTHEILIDTSLPTRQGKWKVPANNYFMMGDNRDNSNDSRFWKFGNFVPEENLVGKASLVWLHWDWSKGGDGFNGSRIGTSID